MHAPNMDAVMRRLRKLARITVDNGATLDEATAAAARIQALLTRYALNVEEIDATLDAPDAEAPIMTDSVPAAGRTSDWRHRLFSQLARINGAASILETGCGYARFRVYGTRRAIDATVYAWTVAHREIDRLGRAYVRAWPYTYGKRRAGASFRYGAVDAFISSMRAAAEAARHAPDVSSRALVRVDADKARAEAALAAAFPRIRYTRARASVWGAAYEAGREAGASINIAPAISGGASVAPRRIGGAS